MNGFLKLLPMLLIGVSAAAQTKPAATPPAVATATVVSSAVISPANTTAAVVSVIQDVTAKRFLPDTTYAALSNEDAALLAKEPIANWGLPMESGKNMQYYNLVVGTRSYQLLVTRAPTAEFSTATLLRFTTPKSKPDYIARGTLKPKTDEKAK